MPAIRAIRCNSFPPKLVVEIRALLHTFTLSHRPIASPLMASKVETLCRGRTGGCRCRSHALCGSRGVSWSKNRFLANYLCLICDLRGPHLLHQKHSLCFPVQNCSPDGAPVVVASGAERRSFLETLFSPPPFSPLARTASGNCTGSNIKQLPFAGMSGKSLPAQAKA